MQHMDSLLVARNRSILGQVFETTSIPPTGKPSPTIFTCIPSVRSEFSLCSVFTRNVSMTKWFEILIDIDMDTHVSVLIVLECTKETESHFVCAFHFNSDSFPLAVSNKKVFHSQSPIKKFSTRSLQTKPNHSPQIIPVLEGARLSLDREQPRAGTFCFPLHAFLNSSGGVLQTPS